MKVGIVFFLSAHTLLVVNGATVRSFEYLTNEREQSTLQGGAPSGYRFVLQGPQSSRDFASFTLPNGAISLGANQTFPTIDSLHSQYPAGTYTTTLEHQATPTGVPSVHSLTLNFPDQLPPHGPIPRVLNDSWQNGALVVAPSFTLTPEPWLNRPSTSLIRLDLGGNNRFFTSTAFGQDVTSYTFPDVFALEPNTRYDAVLTFTDLAQGTSTSIPGSSPAFPDTFRFDSGFGNSTHFTLVTVPEPSTCALLLAALGAVGIYSRRRF